MTNIRKNRIKSKPLPSNFVALAKEHPKGKNWDNLKTDNQSIKEAYEQIPSKANKRYAERLFSCSSFLEFERGGDAWRLSKASFCHVRLCPVCQWRRSLVWQRRFINALPFIESAEPKARYLFLTLTVKNCNLSDTRQTLKDLGKAFKRLTLLKAWPAIGWLRTFEITKGGDGSAHPHIHALLMVKPSYFSHGYIKQAEWSELWQKALRVDYLPQVNIQVIKPKKDTNLSPIQSALLEVFKYSVKPSDLYNNPSFLDELTRQLKGVRSVGLGGLFKEFVKDAIEDLDEIDGVEVQEPERLFYLYYPIWQKYARTCQGR